MTKDEAIKILNSKYPNLKVTSAYKLNSNGRNYILLEAPNVSLGEIDCDDPFYAVGIDGKIHNYSPISDLENFHNALRNKL